MDLFVWARVILSWIPHNQYNEITRTVFNVTEPLLKPIRNLIPTSSLNIDISPFILLFALNMAESLALRTFVY
ncbi:YggT family protein [bacterium]|nr:YggT family protein [bacterium]MBT6018131.1 YggT family protein [bacterium]MBT6777005.1 YggT family protein [bacterium]